MSWSRSVYSTNVSEVAYDSEAQEMTVTWKSGKVSVYSGVPELLADRVSKAPSVSQAINTSIKDVYGHRYR
jgi:hypothetical protein